VKRFLNILINIKVKLCYSKTKIIVEINKKREQFLGYPDCVSYMGLAPETIDSIKIKKIKRIMSFIKILKPQPKR